MRRVVGQVILASEPSVPAGPVPQYVPVIQNRKGELRALQEASPTTLASVTPLVAIVGPKSAVTDMKRLTVRNWVRQLHLSLGSRPCFIDTLRLNPSTKVPVRGGTLSVFEAIFDSAASYSLHAVPVVPVAHQHTAAQQRTARAAAGSGYGAAFRLRLMNVVYGPRRSARDELMTCVNATGVDAAHTDLLVDVGYLPPDQQIDEDHIIDVVSQLLEAARWRAVVLIGTSMPPTLSCVREGTAGFIARREWALWNVVAGRLGASRLGYGDYVIQHPLPPYEQGGPGMRANLRYTLHSRTLVVRGKGPAVSEGREQYQQLCQTLVQRPEFMGADFSWGDHEFAECAEGLIEPGWQSHWRGAGSSHHVRLVVDQLSGNSDASGQARLPA